MSRRKQEVKNLLRFSERINSTINILDNSPNYHPIFVEGICNYLMSSFQDFFHDAKLDLYQLSENTAPKVIDYYDYAYFYEPKSKIVSDKKVRKLRDSLVILNKILNKSIITKIKTDDLTEFNVMDLFDEIAEITIHLYDVSGTNEFIILGLRSISVILMKQYKKLLSKEFFENHNQK